MQITKNQCGINAAKSLPATYYFSIAAYQSDSSENFLSVVKIIIKFGIFYSLMLVLFLS